MNLLEQALEDYVSIRRSLGSQLRQPASLLRNFVAFLRTEGALRITTTLALRWATQPTGVEPYRWAARLGMVRRFAIWYSAMDSRTEIPSVDLLPFRRRRKPPHIYSEEEIERILRRTRQLPSSKKLRARTFTTLFGLLVASGMRINEALSLDRSDVDLERGILHIRRTKFRKSRYVPVHPTTVAALKKYAEGRDRLLPAPSTPAFFISERGRRIPAKTAQYNFAKVSQQLGLRAPAKYHGCGPRLHDLRHRFATRTLIRWYRTGLDVERELPKLSAYLGHVHVNDTYWYLEAVPELLQLATERLIPREVRR
jgi:integrase/recombinase XerD